jgi:hypothetical protein
MNGYLGNMVNRVQRPAPGLHSLSRLPFSTQGTRLREETSPENSGQMPWTESTRSSAEAFSGPKRDLREGGTDGSPLFPMESRQGFPPPPTSEKTFSKSPIPPMDVSEQKGDSSKPGKMTPFFEKQEVPEMSPKRELPASKSKPLSALRNSGQPPVEIPVGPKQELLKALSTDFLMPAVPSPKQDSGLKTEPSLTPPVPTSEPEAQVEKSLTGRPEERKKIFEPFFREKEIPVSAPSLRPKKENRQGPVEKTEAPEIQVHIGRIEVTAVTQLPVPKSPKGLLAKPMSLEEYGEYRRRRQS